MAPVLPSRFPLIPVSVAEESLKYLRTVPIAHCELHSSGFRAYHRPPGSYPKTGVMSGLATIRPQPKGTVVRIVRVIEIFRQ